MAKRESNLTQKVTDKAIDSIKMPVTFKEFSKEPVKAMLFIVTLAIGYLYVDMKMMYAKNIDGQSAKLDKVEMKIDALTNQLRKSDSLLSASSTKLMVLSELGHIK
jgi:hypothetical protein